MGILKQIQLFLIYRDAISQISILDVGGTDGTNCIAS